MCSQLKDVSFGCNGVKKHHNTKYNCNQKVKGGYNNVDTHSRMNGVRVVRTVGETVPRYAGYSNDYKQKVKDVFDSVTTKDSLIELINNDSVNHFQLLKNIICHSLLYNNWDTFDYVIANGAKIDIIEYNDTQLLIHFILENELKAVTKILKAGADPNMNYPIGVVCKMNNLIIATELLKYNVNINDNGVYTHALQHACVYGNDKMVNTLIKSGADVKVTEDMYLFYAYCKMYEGNENCKRIVKMLIKAGVNTNVKNSTNINISCEHPLIQLIQFQQRHRREYRVYNVGLSTHYKLMYNEITVFNCELLLNGKLLNTILQSCKTSYNINYHHPYNNDLTHIDPYSYIFIVNSVHRNHTFKKLIKHNIKCDTDTLMRIHDIVINRVSENIDNSTLMRSFILLLSRYTTHSSCKDLRILMNKKIETRIVLTQDDIDIIKTLLNGIMY